MSLFVSLYLSMSLLDSLFPPSCYSSFAFTLELVETKNLSTCTIGLYYYQFFRPVREEAPLSSLSEQPLLYCPGQHTSV